MSEGPRFKYWAHWSNLLVWLLLGVYWAGLALVILPPTTFGLLFGIIIVAPSPVGVISYFLDHSVELRPNGLRFHIMWDFGEGPTTWRYETIRQIRKTALGGVEIRFTKKRRTIYLRDAERFMLELRGRFEAATGSALMVA